jgi:hypothetical protein
MWRFAQCPRWRPRPAPHCLAWAWSWPGLSSVSPGSSRPLTTSTTTWTPTLSAALKRKLAEITNAEASAFLNKDLLKTMHTYVRQAVKRTEYTRRFGKEGERLNMLLEDARAQGATEAELEQAKKYIMAAEGTLGYDIDPKLRDLMGGITLYENIRLLPMVILSSVVDPLGVAVRSGDMRDAFNFHSTNEKN